jgi:hypothetical protein
VDAMNAALIGLLGLVVGALLTGVTTLWVEGNKRRKSAAVAAYLIAGELGRAQGRVDSALKADPKQWWLGDLPTSAWQERLMELGFKASPDLLQNLSDAYVIIDRLNVDRGLGEMPETTATELQNTDLPAIKIVKDKLDGIAGSLAVKREWRLTRRWGFGIAAAIIVVVALIALIVPRPDVNSNTMAAVVETWSGSHSLASCNPQGVDWSCNVTRLSGPRSACELSASTSSTSTSADRLIATSAISSDSASSGSQMFSGTACTETAVNPVDVSTISGRAVGFSPPSQIERAEAAQRIFASNLPRQRPLAAAWDWIKNLVNPSPALTPSPAPTGALATVDRRGGIKDSLCQGSLGGDGMSEAVAESTQMLKWNLLGDW